MSKMHWICCKKKHESVLNSTETSISSLDASQINNGAAICNDEIMRVETSNLKSGKRNYCNSRSSDSVFGFNK